LVSIAGLKEPAPIDGPGTSIRDLDAGQCPLYPRFARALKPDHVVVVGHRLISLAARVAASMKENGKGRLSLVPSSGSRITLIKNLLIRSIRHCQAPDKTIRKNFGLQQVEEIITRYDCPMESFIAELRVGKLPRIDMAIVDADRPYKTVRLDFTFILASSRKDTIIFLHESNSSMRRFLCLARPPKWLEEMQGEEAWFETVKLPSHSSNILIRVLQN